MGTGLAGGLLSGPREKHTHTPQYSSFCGVGGVGGDSKDSARCLLEIGGFHTYSP